jgi:predicted acylesterase/phospholipase RssA/ABC-type phosphate/phosphonate transport system substrate-binding protein
MAKAKPIEVRVGIVVTEGFEEEMRNWKQCLATCSKSVNGHFTFSLATGTYGDLVHWMDQGQLDLAMVTAGVFAEYHFNPRKNPGREEFDYLASLNTSSDVIGQDTNLDTLPPRHYSYHGVCVVPQNSPWQNIADLKKSADQDDVEFLFVDPLSTSGHIVPANMLRGAGIIPRRDVSRFTFSHTESLRLLNHQSAKRQRVAFVWDGMLKRVPELQKSIRVLPFPALDSVSLPNDIVAIRRNFSEKEELKKLLLSYLDSRNRPLMESLPNTMEEIATIARWTNDLGIHSSTESRQLVTLDEIGRILLHATRSASAKPKLAVVLSGGGAKCAYQAGAVCALEEKLEILRLSSGVSSLDIDLVVGTSGGAFNTMPIALGATRSDAGRKDLQEMWKSLDQRKMIKPSLPVRFSLGLWVGLLQGVLLYLLIWPLIRNGRKRSATYFSILPIIAILDLLSPYFPLTPWSWLGDNHLLHHSWFWIGFGVELAGWPLLAFALFGWLGHTLHKEKTAPFSGRKMVWSSIFLILLLPLIHIITLFFFNSTLSNSEGMEKTLEKCYSKLFNNEFSRRGLPPIDYPANASRKERLTLLSQKIMEERLLKRDAVITVSCLEQTRPLLPEDVYFFTSNENNSHFGHRGLAIEKHPNRLLDVVMGSLSLFPVYPPRLIQNFPEQGHDVKLVDGGYAHNSPVEAAVLQGATHILLIESSPDKQTGLSHLAGNAAAAIDHLHKLTQLVDLRSKQHVVVFTLTPQKAGICVLDFTDTLIEKTIKQGYADAKGILLDKPHLAGVRPTFRKELGEPTFIPVVY